MTKKRKICIPIISRANYGRLKPVLRAIQGHRQLELQLVVGSSAVLDKYGKVDNIIEKDGFKISHRFHMIVEGENPVTMAKSAGIGIIELATIFENLNPDIVIAHGDRFEIAAIALTSSYMNILTADTMAGEISGSIDESVRHAVARLCHIHFATTKKCAERLKQWGEEPERIFVTGCPGMDNLREADLSPNLNLFSRYTSGVGKRIDLTKPYLVVLQHPVTTEYGQGRKQIKETLAAIYQLKIPTIWFWPNVDAGSDEISRGIRAFRERNPGIDFIYFIKNVSVEDFNKLIFNSLCLVGNSSAAIREGSFLGIPAVNLGTRQQGRERSSNVIDVDYDRNQIVNAIKKQISHGKYQPQYIYGDGCASEKIAEILTKVKVPIQKKINE